MDNKALIEAFVDLKMFITATVEETVERVLEDVLEKRLAVFKQEIMAEIDTRFEENYIIQSEILSLISAHIERHDRTLTDHSFRIHRLEKPVL